MARSGRLCKCACSCVLRPGQLSTCRIMLFDQLASRTQTHFCVSAGFCKASVSQSQRGCANACSAERMYMYLHVHFCMVAGFCKASVWQSQKGCGIAQMCGQQSCSLKRLSLRSVNVHMSADHSLHGCRLAQKLVYGKIREALGVRRCVVSGGGSLQPHLDEFYEVLDLTVLNGWGLSEVCCCSGPADTAGHSLK